MCQLAVAVAIAAALPAIILGLTQYKNEALALVLVAVFVGALVYAIKWTKEVIHCDAVLVLTFPQSDLYKAEYGIEDRPWISIQNRGKHDAFEVQIRQIRNANREVGFSKIPVVGS
jgi:hypothetical protein